MMAEPARSYRFSLQAKVMAVVVSVLVALPVITLIIIDQRLQEQMQVDAELALSTASKSFLQTLKLRSDDLASRFRTSTGDTRFLQIVRLGDAATMKDYLRRAVLDELRDDTELAVFVTTDHDVRGARRDSAPASPEAFAAAAESMIQAALRGGEPTGSVAV